MLNVLYTVDVEVWPRSKDLKPGQWDMDPGNFRTYFDRYIHGATRRGTYGLPYQLDLLARHGLKGVFFVEPLFANEFGLKYLQWIVDLIRRYGQSVELHLHPEWVSKSTVQLLDPDRGPMNGGKGHNLWEYPLESQSDLIAKGMEILAACGVTDLCAFRAGNFGAGLDSLIALARNGIRFDSSYNAAYLDSTCRMQIGEPLLQPRKISGVYEFPVNVFYDRPGHIRHLQLGACSFGEMSSMLMRAWRQGMHSVVILSHGSELLDESNTAPDAVVVRRFDRMCRFLAKHKDKFRTCTFAEMDADTITPIAGTEPLRSNLLRTSYRYGEDLIRRLCA